MLYYNIYGYSINICKIVLYNYSIIIYFLYALYIEFLYSLRLFKQVNNITYIEFQRYTFKDAF